MGKERELKFLVVSNEWKQSSQGNRYLQGYLSADKNRTVRVRIVEDSAFLTIKGLKVGDTAPEYEYLIPVEDANEMLKTLCLNHPIEKTRYRVPHGDLIWEVDEFHGKNQGLVLAEIELQPGQEVNDKPEWVGEEVTKDPRYFNSSLAQNPYTTWKNIKI